MVSFGLTRDNEPEPTFFNVKRFKDGDLSTYQKAKKAVRRGVVLFVDAKPPPTIEPIRRRTFGGSGASAGINTQVRKNPQLANYYQLNKIALGNMNAKVIERTTAKIEPLKLAEIALLNKIAENLEKRETAVAIAQTDPPEDQPEKVDQIIAAQGELENIDEQNAVLQEELKNARKQIRDLQQQVKIVEQDSLNDSDFMAEQELQSLNVSREMVDEMVERNEEFIDESLVAFRDAFDEPITGENIRSVGVNPSGLSGAGGASGFFPVVFRPVPVAGGFGQFPVPPEQEREGAASPRKIPQSQMIFPTRMFEQTPLDESPIQEASPQPTSPEIEKQIDVITEEMRGEIETPSPGMIERLEATGQIPAGGGERLIEGGFDMERVKAKEEEIAKKRPSKRTPKEYAFSAQKGAITGYEKKLKDLEAEKEESKFLPQIQAEYDRLGEEILKMKAERLAMGKKRGAKPMVIIDKEVEQLGLFNKIKALKKVARKGGYESKKAKLERALDMAKMVYQKTLEELEEEDQVKAIRQQVEEIAEGEEENPSIAGAS